MKSFIKLFNYSRIEWDMYIVNAMSEVIFWIWKIICTLSLRGWHCIILAKTISRLKEYCTSMGKKVKIQVLHHLSLLCPSTMPSIICRAAWVMRILKDGSQETKGKPNPEETFLLLIYVCFKNKCIWHPLTKLLQHQMQ